MSELAPSLLKKLASQTAIYGLSSIVGRLLNYLLVPIYTRIFTTAEYGVVTELYSYVGFLIVVFTYGMETAFFRYIKEAKQPKKVYSTAMLSLMMSSVILVGLFLFFSQPIANLIDYPSHVEYIIWFALILGFDALAAIPFAYLRYTERPVKFASIKMFNIIVSMSLILFFLIVCPQIVDKVPLIHTIYNPEIGVGYIFIGNLVASALTFLLLLSEIIKIKFEFDRQLWRKMIVYALPLVIAGFAGVINEMLDRVLLKYLLPYDAETNQSYLGIYGACYKLSILMTLFTQAFRFAAEPFFFAQSNQDDAPKVYALTMRYFVIVGAVIFMGVMLFLDMFKYFIGSSFHEGLVVVPILLLANLFLGIYFNLSIWYKLINKTLTGAAIAIFGALITITINVGLIPYMGYIASAWATLICYVSMVLLSYYLGQKHYPIPYQVKRIAGILGLAIGVVLINQQVISLFQSTALMYTLRIGLIISFMVLIFWQEKRAGFSI